jgi:hypothetical protein
MGRFETSDSHSHENLKPLRVARRKEDIYEEAKTMVEDLAGWKLVRADDAGLVLTCEREGGLLRGRALVTVRVEGPDGIPSATVHVAAESSGGLLARDKDAVLEFMRPFHRRVC